jgi:hypothetical protein
MSELQPPATDSAGRPALPGAALRLAIWLLILAVAAGDLYFFYARGLSNLYGDGLAHVEGARRIFDSRTPGFAEIGSVWLPLFHLLAAPLAVNDFLWRTGLAGSLVSTAAFALSAWVIFRFAFELARSLGAAAVSLAIFLLSPNMLYAASSPLTEPLMIFWMVLVAFLVFQFQQSGSRKMLIAASLAAFAGSLTRYDGWYALPFVAVFLVLAREAPFIERVMDSIIFCLISGAGPLLWFVHNDLRYGNAFEFYNGPYSAQAIYARQLATTAFRYPTDGSIILSLRYYLEDVRLVVGPWLLVIAVFGLIAWLIDPRQRRRCAAVLLLLVPLAFYVQSMAFAAIPVYVPTLFPHTYYNLRYGLEMLPAVAIFPAFIADGGRRAFEFPGQVIAASLLLLIVLPQQAAIFRKGARNIPMVQESILNTPCATKTQSALIDYFRASYDGGAILMALGKWPCLNPRVGIPYRNTITEANRKDWARLPEGASKLAEWIVVERGDAVDELMHAYPAAFQYFRQVMRFESPGEQPVAVYRRTPGIRPG